ncbi:MAG: hypothetical protein AB4038_17190 [Prochloraceae cyanobacterium]
MFNFASVIGFLDVILGVFYFLISVFLPIVRRQAIGETGIILYIFQAVIAPICLLVSGIILIWQGSELTQSLQLAYFLLNLLVIYLGAKDIFIVRLLSNSMKSRRKRESIRQS